MLSVTQHYVPNDDGWLLHLEQAVDRERFDPSLRPIAIVPGYGMNAFIFGFHPRGTSMRQSLAESGFEVWSLNLRGQGASRATCCRPPSQSLRAFADVDLTAALESIATRTAGTRRQIDLIGCSLGGSIAYAHLALQPDHRVGAVVSVGSPLRWVTPNPLLATVFRSRRVAGLVRMSGTRELARLALPIAVRMPGLLSMYMNAENVDTSAVSELVRTIEDPSPRVNRDIAAWLRARDMILRGVNVTEALRRTDIPLLVVQANRDGIVPAATALSVLDAWGSKDTHVMHVGDDHQWYSHADLFIGNDAPTHVFQPLATWLKAHQ